MATDLLSRRMPDFGGALSLDDTLLTFPGLSGSAAFIPSIVRQLGLNYGQPITRFYGLNLSKVFLVAGRAQGAATMQQIMSPQGSLRTFFQTYGNVCNAPQNVLQFSVRQGCLAGFSNAQRFLASMCVLTQMAISSSADDPAVSNSTSLTYESLSYTDL